MKMSHTLRRGAMHYRLGAMLTDTDTQIKLRKKGKVNASAIHARPLTASNTVAAWPAGFTFAKTRRITPAPSMTKVDRSMPI